MIIRPEQMSAFEPAAEEHFVERLVETLKEDCAETVVQLPPEAQSLKTNAQEDGAQTAKVPLVAMAVADIPDEMMNEMVRGGIARARDYGLSREDSIAAFVAIMVEIAPNFDSHPLIQYALRDEKMPPDARIDYVVEHTTELTWEIAAQNYNIKSWKLKF